MSTESLETMESPPATQPVAREGHPPGDAIRPRDQDASLLAALERLEALVDEVRRGVDVVARERRHREFSPARLVGSILQSLVVGLVLWGLSDWVFAEPTEGLFVKLAFAAVLQLGALTAFVLGREVA